MTIPQDGRPRLANGCRWGKANGEQRAVLFPEGAIMVQGTGREILERCDGQRTFAQIVDELNALYSADSRQIKQEAGKFLEQLRQKRIIDF
jgi:pyrroloquinoline quinone biosynthesis protein D